MERILRSKAIWLVGGVLIAGAAVAALNRALDLDIDWEQLDDVLTY